jgi:hypothetical protein
MKRRALGLLACSVLVASAAEAQYPPDTLANLKVYPAGMRVEALLDSMARFTRALGVRCNYCHVGQQGQPLSSYDFASDDRPAKAKARVMMRMVESINGEHLPKLATRREPPATVTCATCHHGVAIPRPLQQLVLVAYDAGGVDSAETAYRALRERYYGGAAYDFGEVPLADVAGELGGRGRLADAVRIAVLNVEFSPRSGFAHRQAAEAQIAAGDTASAVRSLERALVIRAEDGQARRRLDELRTSR